MILVLVLVLVFCARSIARRVSNPGRRITRLLRPERLWCGCSYRRLFLAARAIMVSGVLRRGARDPHAREWSGSCSRYRRRLERGRRTSGGVMLGYRVSTRTCRLLAPLLYVGLTLSLHTSFDTSDHLSSARSRINQPIMGRFFTSSHENPPAFLWGPAGAGCVGYLVVE